MHALPFFFVVGCADGHGNLVIGMYRAEPLGLNLSPAAPAGRLATAARPQTNKAGRPDADAAASADDDGTVHDGPERCASCFRR